MLTSEELERYARHIVMREVGGPGQAEAEGRRACWWSAPAGSARRR